MTEEQRKRVHAITYSCDDRAELAERIVELEDELDKLKNNNNYLHETLSESRQANEHLYAELKRHKSILRTRPNAMTALEDENAKLRELVSCMYRNMQGVLDCSTDTVFANSIMTLRDHMDECMEVMAELGMPPRDYESRRRELGLED